MPIILHSDIYRIFKIKNKTQAEVFKDMREGDLIKFSMEIEHTSSASGGGVYASYVIVENLTQNTKVVKSQSQLVNILCRVFELIKEDE